MVLLAAFLVVDTVFRNTILEDQRENLLGGTRLLLELQASEIFELQDLTASLAMVPTLRAAVETRDPATIRQNLDGLLEGSELAWLAVTGPQGELLAATDAAPSERIATADRLVREARYYDTGDLWLHDGRLVHVHASTIFFGSTRLGVLFAGLPIGPERVSRLESSTRQRIAFVAGSHVVAGGPALDDRERADLIRAWSTGTRTTGVGAPGARSASGSAPDTPGQDTVRAFTLAGDRYLGTSIPLPDAAGETAGRLVAFRSLDQALQPVRTLRLALLGIAVTGILLAFAVSYLLAQRVTRPVNRLLEETIRLGSGELDRPVLPERDDEIGTLARGFEQMRVSLRNAREELVRAERLSAVGRAASAIVHDFRQPVSIIQGHVHLLEEDWDDEAQRVEDLATIRRELGRLDGMMREILDFARGGDAVEIRTGNVRELLDEVESAVRPVVASQNVGLEVTSRHDGEWSLDFSRTRRALENLIRNAAAVVPTGGTVRLESERTPDGLRLVVADTGPGIPPDIRDTLFEPFVTHGKKDGTGLGLAIVKSFTERQGGTVRFETSGQGTRFILEFPEIET